MKPQDRTRAILRSKAESSLRLLLIACADHMDVEDSCFPSAATLAEETGLAVSTVKALFKVSDAAGITSRRWEGRTAKVIRIDFDALARYAAPTSNRGGARPKTGPHRPKTGRCSDALSSEDRTPSSEDRTGGVRRPDGGGPKTGPEATIEATKEAFSVEPTDADPPASVQPDGLDPNHDEPGTEPVEVNHGCLVADERVGDQGAQQGGACDAGSGGLSDGVVDDGKPDPIEILWQAMEAHRVAWKPALTVRGLDSQRRSLVRTALKAIKSAGASDPEAGLLLAAEWVCVSENIRAKGARSTGDPLRAMLRPVNTRDYWELASASDQMPAGQVQVMADPAEPWASISRSTPWEINHKGDAVKWLRLNAQQIAEVQEAIRAASKGWCEMRTWLETRVTNPDMVIIEMKAQRAKVVA